MLCRHRMLLCGAAWAVMKIDLLQVYICQVYNNFIIFLLWHVTFFFGLLVCARGDFNNSFD